MGLSKKKDWIKWIRKNLAGLLDTRTGSMETLIDSGSTKTVNYVYSGSSVIADDELFDAAVPPLHQRPMLPPPPLASQDSPSAPQLPNDVYDCCVLLDGIPIKHEFQYTLSDTDGCGKFTKNDVEGLASKILESMYGTTNFSSRGQRTVKVTLSFRQSTAAAVATLGGSPSPRHHMQLHQQQQVGRERRSRSSADKHHYGNVRSVADEPDGAAPLESEDVPIYGELGGLSPSPRHRRVKSGAQRYRRDQLIDMVQKSLAENLSLQNQGKSNKPSPEGHHRTRTKRRQSSAYTGTPQLQSTPIVTPPLSAAKPKAPPKVAWSPYDFEPSLYVPTYSHHEQKQLKKNAVRNNQQHILYSNTGEMAAVDERHVQVKQSSGGRHQHHRSAVVVSNNSPKPRDRAALQEQTKDVDHQRNKRAKLATKNTYHHVHEHHHYHHYNYI